MTLLLFPDYNPEIRGNVGMFRSDCCKRDKVMYKPK